MKNELKFLIEVNKLKETPRTGWVWLKVKDPETIAEHMFRVAVMSWILAREKRPRLNIERVIKISIAHDLCEVYAGDMTPYWGLLPKNKVKRDRFVRRWVRLPQKEKEKRAKIKYKKEKKSLLQLILHLEPALKEEIFSCWLDYEKGITREGKFVKQVDKIEAMLQAIEYFGAKENNEVSGWWEEIGELVEDPLLLDFIKVIQKKLYKKSIKKIKKEKKLGNILDFLLEIGKLKKMPRLYWVIRETKNPETVAEHMYVTALMAWVFGSAKKSRYNMEKLLKMALCHELSAVYIGDITPYDKILPQKKKEKREVLKKWLRLSRKEKSRQFIENFQKEKKALEKFSFKGKDAFNREIIYLWKEYKKKSGLEGQFLSQIDTLAVLLQALLYEKKNKSFSAAPIWEWAFEKCDDKTCFVFFEEAKKRFY